MISEQATTLPELVADRLARVGIVIVSAETAALIADIEDKIDVGLPISDEEFELVLIAVYQRRTLH
jgi:hypothetical protein